MDHRGLGRGLPLRGVVLQQDGQPFAAGPERLEFTPAVVLDDLIDPLGEVLVVDLESVVQRDHREPVRGPDFPVTAELQERGFQIQLLELGAVAGGIKDAPAMA